MEHTVRAEITEAELVKAKSFVIVDPDGNPVVQLRGGENNTLQVLDRYGNIQAELHFGQTPGKHISFL
jgi:hypothetical protein